WPASATRRCAISWLTISRQESTPSPRKFTKPLPQSRDKQPFDRLRSGGAAGGSHGFRRIFRIRRARPGRARAKEEDQAERARRGGDRTHRSAQSETERHRVQGI